jgi:hypothetical protein
MNDVDAKDPDEVKYYFRDWTDGLNTDATISTSTWTVQSGITAGTTGITGAVTRVLLSGGTARTDYTVTNRITTSDGETLERAGVVRVRSTGT